MRKWLAGILTGILLMTGAAAAEDSELSVWVQAEEIRPGLSVIIALTVPEDGECSLRVLDDAGNIVSVVSENRKVSAGENYLYWNGTWEGVAAPPGEWILQLEILILSIVYVN